MKNARTKQKMPHILFAASGSDSVWHPTACQGGGLNPLLVSRPYGLSLCQAFVFLLGF